MSGLFFLLRLAVAALVLWLAYRALRRWWRPTTSRTEQNNGPAGADLVQCPTCRDYLPKTAPRCTRLGCPRSLLIVLTLLCGFSAPAMAEGGGRYLFELTGENVVATLEVNGLVAGKWTLHKRDTIGASFNHWLRAGSNTLRVRISPLAGRGKSQVSGRAYFLALANGQQSNLLAFLDPQNFKPEQSVSFKLTGAPRLALWEAQAREQTDGILDAFYTSWDSSLDIIAKGQSLAAVPLVSTEYADFAAAYGAAASTHPIAIRPGSGQIVKVSARPVKSDLQIQAVSGTSLYRLSRKDGAPLFQLEAGQGNLAAQAVLMGYMGQSWRVLRRVN